MIRIFLDHGVPVASGVPAGGSAGGSDEHTAFDWSTTALGPLEQWPQSLRAYVPVMLGSGYPKARILL